MLMNRLFIKKNITFIAIVIFLAIYIGITYSKPSFLYNQDGSLRNFGLNSNKRTVIPAWLMSILIAILSYLFVLYYVALPRFVY